MRDCFKFIGNRKVRKTYTCELQILTPYIKIFIRNDNNAQISTFLTPSISK